MDFFAWGMLFQRLQLSSGYAACWIIDKSVLLSDIGYNKRKNAASRYLIIGYVHETMSRSKPWINDLSAAAAFAQPNLHEILMCYDGFLPHWFIAFLHQGCIYWKKVSQLHQDKG